MPVRSWLKGIVSMLIIRVAPGLTKTSIDAHMLRKRGINVEHVETGRESLEFQRKRGSR